MLNLLSVVTTAGKHAIIRDIFSITKLVAVEAKMSNLSKVVEQSFLNTWFASIIRPSPSEGESQKEREERSFLGSSENF
jgi:hypothetical protein